MIDLELYLQNKIRHCTDRGSSTNLLLLLAFILQQYLSLIALFHLLAIGNILKKHGDLALVPLLQLLDVLVEFAVEDVRVVRPLKDFMRRVHKGLLHRDTVFSEDFHSNGKEIHGIDQVLVLVACYVILVLR